MIKYIHKNYISLFTIFPIIVYLYYFDQSFQVLSVIIDLRTSIFLIFLILFIEKNIQRYWSFLKNVFFFLIFIYIQSYLIVIKNFEFSIGHYLKVVIIILFLSILICYSNFIYTRIYKIIYLFIITFPLVYLCSRLYCFFLVN